MEAENEHRYRIQGVHEEGSCCLQVFQLYQTQSMFYMIGRNKNRSLWRVLKIDRLEPTELNIHEDFTSYSEVECHDLLRMIHEGNKATGGLKFVTDCYGIVGFIKFLGPYYMLLITERQKIGAICGHTIYSITKSEMMPLSSSYVQFNMNYSRIENRYKKLFCTVDLTKDFFFSYSYHVMRSLQRNLCDNDAEQVLYETMFVWNAFLTRGIRNNLNNTLWTVALVYGFFKQTKLSVGRKDFKLTLIARRSRHYAGTRYLKRGVNENGRVANDVEIEQLVFEDVSNGHPSQISSVVQHRGSIPLFWSQETSRLNMKPDIKLQKKDVNYEATRLHFENLVKRYGKPIIILNLIKTREKNPRESLLRTEFANAIDFINKDLSEENRLKFIHWDLHRLSRSKATNVLNLLGKVAAYVLNLTGFLYCQVTPDLELDGVFDSKFFQRNDTNGLYPENDDINDAKVMDVLQNGGKAEVYYLVKPRMFQEGVLRTNCIDCLDRTNVAQYAYGLAALGRQLHTLGLIDVPKVDLDSPLADNLMIFYEIMGDTLALQYGGSAAHNKIFSARRGQWKAATQSQEFFRTLQRYYSNSYMDAEKQEAINVFLGNFQPQHDKLALWETDKNKCENFSEHYKAHGDDLTRDLVKRSLSDGNILRGSNTPVSIGSIEQGVHPKSALTERGIVVNKGLSDSAPDISTSKNDVFYSSYNPSSVCRKLFSDRWDESNHIYFSHDGRGDALNCSNVLDLDCLTSFENSCQDKMWEKSLHGDSPAATFMPNFYGNGISMKSTAPVCENGSNVKMAGNADIELLYDELQNAEILNGYSDRFVHWINYGETLCR